MKEKAYKLDKHTEAHVYQSVDGPAMSLNCSIDKSEIFLHKTEARKLVKLLKKFVNTKEVQNVVRKKVK